MTMESEICEPGISVTNGMGTGSIIYHDNFSVFLIPFPIVQIPSIVKNLQGKNWGYREAEGIISSCT